MKRERQNLSGRFHTESLSRLRNTDLPHRLISLLDSIFWKSQDYQGKGDVWWQLIDLLEESMMVPPKQSEFEIDNPKLQKLVDEGTIIRRRNNKVDLINETDDLYNMEKCY